MEYNIPKELNKPLMTRILIILAVFITPNHFVRAGGVELAFGNALNVHTIYQSEEQSQNTQFVSMHATAAVTVAITAAINAAIVDALKKKAISLFKNAIVNEFFAQEPDFATLSEESLEDIRLIVRDEMDALLTHFSQSDARSALHALSYNLTHYSAKAAQNEFDRNLLAIIASDSAVLITDKAFSRDDFPSSFFFMADTYALSTTLRLAVLTEDFLQDDLTDLSFINNQAQQMVDVLQAMRSGVSRYVNHRVRFSQHESCKLGSRFCTWTIEDDIGEGGRTYSSFDHSAGQVIGIYLDLQNTYKLSLMSQEARDTLVNLRAIAELEVHPFLEQVSTDGTVTGR